MVAIDPAATHGEDADDTGIIVVGRGPCQAATCVLARDRLKCPGHGYVLGDYTCNLPPSGWANEAIKAYDHHGASRIVAERNNGGDMVGHVVQSARPGIPYTPTYATHGKLTRAEPASAMHEQGRIHILYTDGDEWYTRLEEELISWTPDAKWSPNRLDAMVWGLWELKLIGGQGAAFMAAWAEERAAQAKTATIPVEADQLKRLPSMATTPEPEERICACTSGRRYFDGHCVKCGGVPPSLT